MQQHEIIPQGFNREVIWGQWCQLHFIEFVRHFWSVVDGKELSEEKYIQDLAFHLQALGEGKITSLVINCPPGVGKSVVCSVLFPAWLLVRDQTEKLITASYAYKLAERDSLRHRRLIESEKFRSYYPHIKLASDQQSKGSWELSTGGGRVITSTDAQGTGYRATTIIVDDPQSATDARSEVERKKTIQWWSETLNTRLNEPETGKRLIVQHRLHEEDLTGFILSHDAYGRWCNLCLPYEAPKETTPNLFGWTDTRAEGEPLTLRTGTAWAKEKKSELGYGPYQAQYNQDPTPAEGDFFKREWFRHYKQEGDRYQLGERWIEAKDCWRLLVCDPAISQDHGCYTVVQIWAVTPEAELILLDSFRKQVKPTSVISHIEGMYRKWNPDVAIVEDVGAFRFLTDELRARGLVIRGYRPKPGEDKEIRAFKSQGKVESGTVWWREDHGELEAELLAFPQGKFADQCDALSMGVIQAERRGRYRRYRDLTETPTPEQQERNYVEALLGSPD
ncbi:MAG: hypothetical protein QM703_22810 [Gemmatales bacterium]